MDWDKILLVLILDLILTVFGYLLVPTIYCLRKKPLSAKKIKKIIIINAICVWLVFQIIRSAAGESGASAAVFLWSWVGHIMMKKHLLVEEESDPLKDDSTSEGVTNINAEQVRFCRKCGNPLNSGDKFCRKCGTEIIILEEISEDAEK